MTPDSEERVGPYWVPSANESRADQNQLLAPVLYHTVIEGPV